MALASCGPERLGVWFVGAVHEIVFFALSCNMSVDYKSLQELAGIRQTDTNMGALDSTVRLTEERDSGAWNLLDESQWTRERLQRAFRAGDPSAVEYVRKRLKRTATVGRAPSHQFLPRDANQKMIEGFTHMNRVPYYEGMIDTDELSHAGIVLGERRDALRFQMDHNGKKWLYEHPFEDRLKVVKSPRHLYEILDSWYMLVYAKEARWPKNYLARL
jgi:hypothetical protein